MFPGMLRFDDLPRLDAPDDIALPLPDLPGNGLLFYKTQN